MAQARHARSAFFIMRKSSTTESQRRLNITVAFHNSLPDVWATLGLLLHFLKGKGGGVARAWTRVKEAKKLLIKAAARYLRMR